MDQLIDMEVEEHGKKDYIFVKRKKYLWTFGYFFSGIFLVYVIFQKQNLVLDNYLLHMSKQGLD